MLPDTGVCNGAGAFDDPDAVAVTAPVAGAAVGAAEPELVTWPPRPVRARLQQPPAAGALDAAGLRRVVGVLSTVQIVSWGVLYYAFAALQSSIAADTGWSSVAVTGAFSLAQLVSGGVGIWVGRHIDAFGPRAVMTAASLVAVPGRSGGAGAEPGRVLPRLGPRRRRDGRHPVPTRVRRPHPVGRDAAGPRADDPDAGGRPGQHRLRAPRVRPRRRMGLASGLPGAPRPVWCSSRCRCTGGDWRAVADRAHRPPRAETADATAARGRSAPFVLLAVSSTLTTLAVYAVVINLVPMLVEQGMSRNLAAVALGLGGVGQVVGRLGYARFAAATSVTSRGVIVVAGVAVATAALALAPDSPACSS